MISPPANATPPVQEVAFVSDFETDSFRLENGKTLKITFIKHASLILDYDNHILYVDPVSMYADFSKLPKADVILITHEHSDHFDTKAISAIEKKTTKLISNESCQKKLAKGQILRNGEGLNLQFGLHIKAIPAYNTTPERFVYHPKGRDNGYLLTIDKFRIYIAGDTEDIPEMSHLGKVDIAFIPVNQPYTMTVDQAVNAAKLIKSHILYPYHYGETKIELLKEKLKTEPNIDVRIRQLQ